jgi:hypothetical protein
MILSLTAIIAILFIASTVVWLGISVPHLVGFTTSLIEWCRSIFELCMSYSSVVTGIFLWTGVVALGGGVLYAVLKGGLSLLKSYRGIRRLPLSDRGLSLALIKDDSVKVAFTHGLIRPKIYVSTGLLNSLTRDEIRAVLLHEIHHKKNRDPLRFFLVTLLRDTFFYLPIGGYITKRLHAMKERAADDAVVKRTADPFAFAETLLKVARFGADMSLGIARIASIRGSGSVEGRIRRLVEGREGREERPRFRVIFLSVLVAATLLLSVSLPLSSSTRDPGSCDMGHCSTHVETIGNSCRVHCAEKLNL